MGVKGLQFYLEQCCKSASPSVSISELVAQHRGQNYDEELVIVVDGSSCIRHLYGDLEWIGGGQLKQFGEIAQQFVQSFADLGIRLVFFFDGPTIEKKRKTWIERRLTTMGRMYSVFDKIQRGVPTHTIPKGMFQLPPGMGQLSRLIFEIICGCEVYQSLTECDEEIAEYARNHRVFAILGQDSDFVILDSGDALYMSMQHLDLQNMTTRLYEYRELARHLRLHPSQLPVLATFMGNDIVSADDLKRFHHNISNHRYPNQRVDFRVLIPNIAMYIRSLPPYLEELYNMLPDISQKILQNPSRARDIRISIESYKSSPLKDLDSNERGRRRDHWAQLVAEARRRHQNNQLPSMVYAIMNGLPFESSTSLEDFRLQDLPSFASATEPIRERLYGILLQEKRLPTSGQHYVKEWCMAGPHSLDEPKFVEAVPPHPKHPGLMALWSNRGDLTSVRWQLFVHSVSPDLDVDRVRNLPSYLVIPTLIMYYINKLDYLEPWEVDAMLATAVLLGLEYYDVARVAAVPADPVSPRGIRVGNLIMRSTFVLYILLAACGYPLTMEQTAPWLFFDGKVFQSKYRQAEARSNHGQLCEHRGDVLENFQMARSIVFANY